MSFIKKLQIDINKVTKGYFANWTPDSPIEVGDYGDVNGYRFTKDGNISRYNLDLELDSVRLKTATFEKKSGLIIKANTGASAEAGELNAKIDLKFGSEGSFLYHLKDITNIQFKERQVAFEKIGKLILSGNIKWKDDYVLVVEVKQAGKALIIVADSASADMQIECNADASGGLNLANAVGNIEYTRDSDRVIKYEVEETISPLYRVVALSSAPSDGGPILSVSKMMEKVRSWFSQNLPKPETIFLADYVEQEDQIVGTFKFSNGESITLCQKHEDINSLIQKSEKEDREDEKLDIKIVQVVKRETYG